MASPLRRLQPLLSKLFDRQNYNDGGKKIVLTTQHSSKPAPAHLSHLSHLRITAHTTCTFLCIPAITYNTKFPSVWLTSWGAFLQDPLGDATVFCQCQDAGNAQQLNTGTKHRRWSCIKGFAFLSRLNLVVQRYELGRTLDEPVFFWCLYIIYIHLLTCLDCVGSWSLHLCASALFSKS